jgi:hypothetical protein
MFYLRVVKSRKGLDFYFCFSVFVSQDIPYRSFDNFTDFCCCWNRASEPVLLIHEILVWIHISD